MPPRPTVDENEIEEAFLKGTGPGGQKIVGYSVHCRQSCFNRASTYSQVIYGTRPAESDLLTKNKTSSAVQLKHLPTGIVVKSQETRSRSQNRKIARRLLAEKLEQIQLGDQSRSAIKTREARKKKASAGKKKRRKYRSLQEGTENDTSEETDERLNKDNNLSQAVLVSDRFGRVNWAGGDPKVNCLVQRARANEHERERDTNE